MLEAVVHQPFSRVVRNAVALSIALASAAVAGCGGGGSSTPSTPAATPTPVPGSATLPIPQSGGSLVLPLVNGQGATLTFSAGAPAGATITAIESTTAPAGAPSPSGVRRIASVPGAVPYFFVAFNVSVNIPSGVLAGDSVTLTSAQPATASYFVELDDMTAAPMVLTICGPTAPNALVFATDPNHPCAATAASENPFTVGHKYLLQFYYVPAG